MNMARRSCLPIFSYVTITVLLILTYSSGICAQGAEKSSNTESTGNISKVNESASLTGKEDHSSVTGAEISGNNSSTNLTGTTTGSGGNNSSTGVPTPLPTNPTSEAPVTTTLVPSDPNPPPPSTNLNIYVVNDLEYDFFPVHADNGTICRVEEAVTDACVGGLARLKSYMNATGNESIWLNTGNTLGGSLFPELKFGAALDSMKLLDFNATTEGLNAFKYGVDAGQEYLSGLNSTVITNIDPQPKQKSLMFQVGSCNVSVIGFVDGTDLSQNISGVTIGNYTKYILDEINKTKLEQKDPSKLIIVVIGNTNVSRAREIAKLDDIDFVFFSGANWSSEALEAKNDSYWESIVTGNKTAFVGSVKVNHTNLINRFVVGHIQFSINETCSALNTTELKVKSYYNNTNYEPALELMKMELRNLESQNETLTRNTKNLTGEAGLCCHAECSVGNLITDAMVAALKSDSIWSRNGSRIGIFPAIHLTPNKTIPEDVTALNLNELIDEDVYIYSIALTAPQLKAVLEISINSTNSSDFNSTDFLHTSGLLQVGYYEKPVNESRIASIKTVVETSMEMKEIDLEDNSTLYNVSIPMSLKKMESYKKLLDSVNASYHAVTVIEAVTKYLNNTGFLFLPALGTRLMKMELPAPQPTPSPPPPAPSPPCESHTGTTVIVTLVVAALILALSFVAWKYVIRRYSGGSCRTLLAGQPYNTI